MTVARASSPEVEKRRRNASARAGSLSITINIPSGASTSSGENVASAVVAPIASTRLAPPRTIVFTSGDCTLSSDAL